MEPIWIVFSVAEFDGIGSACIVAESKVEAFLKSEAETVAIGDEHEGYEQGMVDRAMLEFTDYANTGGWGKNQAISINLESKVYHFQRVASGTVYPTFMPDEMWHLIPEQFKN